MWNITCRAHIEGFRMKYNIRWIEARNVWGVICTGHTLSVVYGSNERILEERSYYISMINVIRAHYKTISLSSFQGVAPNQISDIWDNIISHKNDSVDQSHPEFRKNYDFTQELFLVVMHWNLLWLCIIWKLLVPERVPTIISNTAIHLVYLFISNTPSRKKLCVKNRWIYWNKHTIDTW